MSRRPTSLSRPIFTEKYTKPVFVMAQNNITGLPDGYGNRSPWIRVVNYDTRLWGLANLAAVVRYGEQDSGKPQVTSVQRHAHGPRWCPVFDLLRNRCLAAGICPARKREGSIQLPAGSRMVSAVAPAADEMYPDFPADPERSAIASNMSGVALATRSEDLEQTVTYWLEGELAEFGGDDRRGTRRPFPWSVPLLAVLALQTFLSLRLIWSRTASNDEALYLWAGHLELAHILHGTPVPGFQTYFSGAPFIYPPLGAVADSLGGLAAARILSLAFMLGATVLVYGTTRQLFGRRAGEIGAGSFGLLGSAEFLGAFATYDAMALFLLALAAYLVVLARGWFSEPLLIAAGLVLALADATKYPTTLWNPVLISLAALTATRGGWLRQSSRAVRLALYTSAPIVVALLRLGRSSY